jgi:hypothetical protein
MKVNAYGEFAAVQVELLLLQDEQAALLPSPDRIGIMRLRGPTDLVHPERLRFAQLRLDGIIGHFECTIEVREGIVRKVSPRIVCGGMKIQENTSMRYDHVSSGPEYGPEPELAVKPRRESRGVCLFLFESPTIRLT